MIPENTSMSAFANIPPDPARPDDVFEVGTYSDDIYGPPPPPVRSLEAIRLDLKRKRLARRRRQQEREMARETELRRQMIARRKEWDDAQ